LQAQPSPQLYKHIRTNANNYASSLRIESTRGLAFLSWHEAAGNLAAHRLDLAKDNNL
jgi:hypothetical protein